MSKDRACSNIHCCLLLFAWRLPLCSLAPAVAYPESGRLPTPGSTLPTHRRAKRTVASYSDFHRVPRESPNCSQRLVYFSAVQVWTDSKACLSRETVCGDCGCETLMRTSSG